MARKKFQHGPFELPCGDGARLIFANDGDFWDVAYYRLPDGEKFEERFAIRKRILLDAFRVLLAEADEPFDADLLIDWVKRQPWSHKLRHIDRDFPLPLTPQEEIEKEENERLAKEYEEAAPATDFVP